MMMKMLQDTKPNRFYDMTLKNTYKSDDIKKINNQVETNLIDNAIVSEKYELKDIVNEEIDKEIPYLDLVQDKNIAYGRTVCRISLRTTTIQRLKKWYEEKYEQKLGVSVEVNFILEEYLDKIDVVRNEDACQYIKYEGSTPRIDVLRKLFEIAKQQRENNTNLSSISKIIQIIKDQGFKDKRTIEKYEKCIRNYSIKRNHASIAGGDLNMSGFYEGVLDLIKKWDDGKNTDHDKTHSPKESSIMGTGVAPTIQNAINEAKTQPKAMHDFRIKYYSTQTFQNAVNAGNKPHSKNKGIMEEPIPLTPEITANITIYPRSVQVILACTQIPIPYNVKGAKELRGCVAIINDKLSKKYKIDKPDLSKWISFYYDLNQDGTKELSDEKLCQTITDSSEEKTKTYAKSFDDGTKRMRVEKTITDKISLVDLLKDMEKYAK